MKPIRTILSSLLLVAFAGSAFAQAPTTLANDKAQLKSDETALTAAKQKLDADKITLKDNTKSGRTTAESPDAKQVRLDKRSVDGMKKNIAAGEPGPQMTSDKAALKKSKKKLRTSKKKLKTDKKSGRMEAQSKDSQAVFKDKQSVKAQAKTVDAGRDKVEAAEKK